jgi:hypothetical protein
MMVDRLVPVSKDERHFKSNTIPDSEWIRISSGRTVSSTEVRQPVYILQN